MGRDPRVVAEERPTRPIPIFTGQSWHGPKRGKEGEGEGKIKGEGKGEKGVEEVKEGEGRGKMFWKESGRRSLYDEG